MGEIKLLDCTLRDGGYVNDWEFGHSNIVSTFERLVNAGVDIIEIGFLDERRPFDKNRSIMPSTECVEKIYGKVNKKNSMIVGMIDYGTCPIENIQPCGECYLDGIRVIFKKHLMYEAMEFCRQLKALGYKVFSQMVSITSYSDDELDELIALANEVRPFAVSMVDTYGLLYHDNLLHYFEYLNERLASQIGLGYHSHNNFQLAYSNCMEVLRKETRRTIVVDGSLYGMGKSAGNAPLELLAMHMNDKYKKEYDMAQLLEIIDGNIMKVYQKTPWGYNLFFYLAASNSCHPNYVQFLMDKHTLSIKSINTILDKIEQERKLMYNKKYIEELYYQYQKNECDDSADRKDLTQRLNGNKILIVGPGKTVENNRDEVLHYIEEKQPTVISINFIPDGYPIDFVFLSNPRRYIHLVNAMKANKDIEVIATSNVTETRGKFEYTLNNELLLDPDAEIMDNSFVMLLKILKDIGIENVMCAGLDGYSENEPNYANPDMEYWFARRKSKELNDYVRNFLSEISGSMEVDFITPTHYKE